MATINEVARAVGMSRQRVTRAIDAGALPVLKLGKRRMIDLEEAEKYFAIKRSDGIGIDALSTATGLTVSAIRRGIQEGWIPHWKYGRNLRFDREQVFSAIQKRIESSDE
ncbi:MAG: helix-turn-helix domain-containing protein [Eubacteriales bacterium]|nr:helix-turn-helix domain-containing protein [Eubacteriales bacterium]